MSSLVATFHEQTLRTYSDDLVERENDLFCVWGLLACILIVEERTRKRLDIRPDLVRCFPQIARESRFSVRSSSRGHVVLTQAVAEICSEQIERILEACPRIQPLLFH